MVVSVLGFGHIWTTRGARNRSGAAHFNTTGVLANGAYRHRSCVYGQVRLNGCTGFDPDKQHHWVHKTYDAEPLVQREGRRRVFLRQLLPAGALPDRYLARIESSRLGWIDRSSTWMCEEGELVSFSEGAGQQEALVLLPPFGWIRTELSLYHLDCSATGDTQPDFRMTSEGGK